MHELKARHLRNALENVVVQTAPLPQLILEQVQRKLHRGHDDAGVILDPLQFLRIQYQPLARIERRRFESRQLRRIAPCAQYIRARPITQPKAGLPLLKNDICISFEMTRPFLQGRKPDQFGMQKQESPSGDGLQNVTGLRAQSGLPRLPCWLTKACTAFKSLGNTVQRSSRSNKSERCAGSSSAFPTPAFSTASGNLTG